MKEIKFRAKRGDNNKWIYGGIYKYETEKSEGYVIVPKRTTAVFIMEDYSIFIDPRTIGQYIYRKDKNGKEIYEGDILSWKLNKMDREYIIIKDIFTLWRKALEFESLGIGHWELPSISEIIGNVYDNPELLKNISKV